MMNVFSKFLLIVSLPVIFIKAQAQLPWPGEEWQSAVNLTSLDAAFSTNMSGQFWNPLKRELWVVSNSGIFWRLKEGGTPGWMIDSTGGNARWVPGGDLEDITQANLDSDCVFIMNESGYIEEYDVSSPGTVLLLHSWDIRAVAGPNGGSGPEGIAFVPDEWLSYNGFVDQNGNPYTSINGMEGVFFVAHQDGGYLYAFDLNPGDTSFNFVGKYETGYAESSGLAFDRTVGKLFIWHNTGSNYFEVSQLTSSNLGGGIRKLDVQTSCFGPRTGNLEGIAFTPLSTGEDWYFATDDSNQDGYAVYWFRSFGPCVFEPFFNADRITAYTDENIVFTDTSVGLCGAESFIWNFGAGASPSTDTGRGPHTVSYSTPGSKDIKLKISGNYTDSLVKYAYVTISPYPYAINTLYAEESLKVFPNPSPDGCFRIAKGTGENIIGLQVFNHAGRLVFISRNEQDALMLDFPGSFILHIITDKRIVYKKLVVINIGQ